MPPTAGITWCAMVEFACVRTTPNGRPPEFLSIRMAWDIRRITWERRSLNLAPTVTASRRQRSLRLSPDCRSPGQAIFQYAGVYPQPSSYLTNTNYVYAQTDYRFNEKLTALFGLQLHQRKRLHL